jgi:hypothetical protein
MSTTNGVQRTHQQQARRLADETGMPYTAALRQTAAETEAATPPKPASQPQAFVNAENTAWERLWGRHVAFADPAREVEGAVPHHFYGLVLPPAPGSRAKRWRLRVLPTGRTEPITVDGRRWRLNPRPADLGGAPRYDFDKGPRPPEGLMTPNMLRKRMRAEPAKGQHPAGVLDGDWGSAKLYYIHDTTPMPELKGKRATVWQRNRTCVNCGKQRDLVWPLLGDTGKRTCPDCELAVAQQVWRERKRDSCAQVQAWAADVLGDANAVLLLVHADHGPKARFEVATWRTWRVTDLATGEVRFESDAFNAPLRGWDSNRLRAVSTYPDGQEAWIRDYRALDAALAGRRIILVSRDLWPGEPKAERWWSLTVDNLELEPMRHVIAPGDDLDHRARPWFATLPDQPDRTTSVLSGLRDFTDDTRGHALPEYAGGMYHGSLEELTAIATQALADMASGAAPGLESGEDQEAGQ